MTVAIPESFLRAVEYYANCCAWCTRPNGLAVLTGPDGEWYKEPDGNPTHFGGYWVGPRGGYWSSVPKRTRTVLTRLSTIQDETTGKEIRLCQRCIVTYKKEREAALKASQRGNRRKSPSPAPEVSTPAPLVPRASTKPDKDDPGGSVPPAAAPAVEYRQTTLF